MYKYIRTESIVILHLPCHHKVHSAVNPADCNIFQIFFYYTVFWKIFPAASEKYFQLRNKDDHDAHCTAVEKDKSGESSKEYGINGNSVLDELKHFHVCDG